MFGRNLVDFWCQNGGKLAPKWDQKLMFTWEGDFSKIVLWLQRGLDFSGSGGPSWEQKSIKNRSKNGIQDGMHLGIDFWMILLDLGCQVGRQNRSKIASKKRCKKQSRLGRVLGRLRAVKGAATYSDPVRRNPTGRKSSPGGRQGRRPFAQKYQLKRRQS